ERDEQPELDAPARECDVSGEAVHDPAPLEGTVGGQEREGPPGGVATVREDGLPEPARQRHLRAERARLRIPRCAVAEEIEAGLADRDDAGRRRQPLALR